MQLLHFRPAFFLSCVFVYLLVACSCLQPPHSRTWPLSTCNADDAAASEQGCMQYFGCSQSGTQRSRRALRRCAANERVFICTSAFASDGGWRSRRSRRYSVRPNPRGMSELNPCLPSFRLAQTGISPRRGFNFSRNDFQPRIPLFLENISRKF